MASGMTSSARDIPTRVGRDTFAAVAARSVPAPPKAHPLPTPPNSISPSLPPHGLKAYGVRSIAAPSIEVDSDIDLQDGGDGDGQGSSDGHDIGSPGDDAAGVSTPALLAKHHLPDILLAHGPLAIRHITGYLTTSVPGFSGIPPAKARRLVVNALEVGRGVSEEEVAGAVKFEKVGWGRWNAKLNGANRRAEHSPPLSGPSSYAFGMPIPRTPEWTFERTRLSAPSSSWAGNSATFSHDEDMDASMLENEADKMSLDGSCSSPEAPAEDDIMGDDLEDMTDEEDWAALGAAALRSPSTTAGTGHNLSTSRIYAGGFHGGGGPSLMARSVPLPNSQRLNNHDDHDFSTLDIASNSQEREAVEALLRLGSV